MREEGRGNDGPRRRGEVMREEERGNDGTRREVMMGQGHIYGFKYISWVT